MPESPSERQARELYRQQRQITLASVRAVDNVLSDTDDVDRIAAVIAAYQLASATAAASSYDNAAGQTLGIIADAFAGFNAVGLPLQIPLETIFDDAGRFTSGTGLKTNPRHRVVRFAASQVQDAGRGVGQAAIVSHPEWTNYVRVLNPPSCSRCAILAGRIYRDLAHFQRHPLCDCQMWPVASWEKAHDAGLVVSARTAFRDGQIRGLSEADTRAIEDGADINQVVNAAQGMTRVEMFGRKANATLAGTTTRSQWRKDHPNLKVRLRPETIYAEANGNRDEALRLLRVHGFIRDDATSSGSSSGSGSSGGSRGSGTGDSGPNDRVLPFDDDHPFTGKLGTAGAANPPTVELLQRLAVVAPVSDRRRYLDDRAGDVVTWLEVRGVTSLSVHQLTSNRRRTPDLVLDQHAVTAEAKRLDEATANAVTQNIRSARGQSARVVIDGRQAGLDEATATRGLNRALRLYGLQLREVVILLGDGRAIGWGRGS